MRGGTGRDHNSKERERKAKADAKRARLAERRKLKLRRAGGITDMILKRKDNEEQR